MANYLPLFGSSRFKLRVSLSLFNEMIKNGCVPPQKPINSEQLESPSKLREVNSGIHAKNYSTEVRVILMNPQNRTSSIRATGVLSAMSL